MSSFRVDKKLIYKTSAIVIPTLFIILSIIITMYVRDLYDKTETQLIENQIKFASFELSENLRRTIMYRAKILEITAETKPEIFTNNNKKEFDHTISVILENIPDFHAINWVAPDGHIRWILPEDKNNTAAIGKNVLKRSEVTKYLEAARDTKSVQISHIIDLYQGPKGLILYIPIFDRNIFRGWYNGVIDIQSSLDRFFERRKIKNLHLRVAMKDHKDYAYTYGVPANDSFKKISLETQMLNQTMTIDVLFSKNTATGRRHEQLKNVFIAIYISIVIIAAFLFYLIRSQFKFMNLNRKLTRDRTLINILSHDMATPLTLISENIKRLKEKLSSKEYPEMDRILRSSEKQMSLLTRVRSFHATNIGKIHIELIPAEVSELIDEAICGYEDALKEKNITYSIEIPEGKLYCLTDRMTAIDNVLGNVLSNAIKFSNNDTKITIRAYTHNSKYVVIEVADQGAGIPKNVLAHIFNENERTSRTGTKGETGTGLGMLQVKAFMEYYKGFVKIHSSEAGTQVRLYFLKTHI